MERHRRVRRSTLASALATALAVSVLLPAGAAGDPVGDLLGGLGVGGNAGGGSGGGGGGGTVSDAPTTTDSAQDRAGTPPNYKPPLHGTNPHGQGSVATVDINPLPTNPYPSDPAASQEEVVIGDSRGEKNPDGSYRGRVTLLWLFGVPFVQVQSGPGQTSGGPVPPAALNTVCAGTAGGVCVNLLTMNSSTSGTGSSNFFQAAGASLLGGAITANVAESRGDINEAGGCQGATGSSSLANGTVLGAGFNVLPASSSSTACYDGSQSNSNSGGAGTPLSLVLPAGCGAGAANTNILFPLGLGGLVCNADDTNSGQTSNPYGVREALTLILTLPAPAPTIKAVLSGPESRVVAPPAPPTTPGTAPGGQGGAKGKAKPGGAGGEEAGAAAGEAAPGGGQLAFTGQNLLLLGLIGAGLISLGLLGMAAWERRTV